MIRWQLTGTENQQAIAREAFNRIKFPFDKLTALPGTPELGWDDLNGRMHSTHIHSGGGDRPDPLVGTDDKGRKWTMGVIYTLSGRIYLDTRLEADPPLAMAVVAAEIAHAVDFFLPMTDAQRDLFLALWGNEGTTWWESVNYSAEYFRLAGEAFMHEFVGAYTDLEFGDKTSFLHDAGVDPADVRRVLGIERTDSFVRYGTSKVYHKPTHRVSKRAGIAVTNMLGMRPCKQCEPGAAT